MFDIKYFLEGDILQKIDRLSMANSLEVRVPFLDHNIVEESFRIPNDILFRKKRKYVLKKILEKDFDNSFIYRNKIGFRMDTDNMNDFLLEQLKKRKYIAEKYIYSKDDYGDSYLNFAVLIFKMWYEKNIF